jgi:hypothetical protein
MRFRGPKALTDNIEERPFGIGFDGCSLRSDCRQGSKPASRRFARASLRVLDCKPVKPATVRGWKSYLENHLNPLIGDVALPNINNGMLKMLGESCPRPA